MSAWFPAGVFVFLVLLIANVSIAGGSVKDAIGHITGINAAGLVLLSGAVILTTVLTQAFELEAIRLLEGYWGPGRMARRLADWRSDRHVARLEALVAREQAVKRRAWPSARHTMLARGIPRASIDIIEAQLTKQPDDTSASAADKRIARTINFMDHAAPAERRRYRALVLAKSQYPPERLVLPTRLGNTLRAYEKRAEQERARQEGADRAGVSPLENLVREVFHVLPLPLQAEHQQFRSRLDLYCALVVVFSLSGAGAVVAFAPLDGLLSAGSGLLALVLVWLSYRAAVASAREYGRVLQAIARFKPDSS